MIIYFYEKFIALKDNIRVLCVIAIQLFVGSEHICAGCKIVISR